MKGNSSLFAPKSSVAVGDIVFSSNPTQFFANIAKRKNIDANGILDVAAHGSPSSINVIHKGQAVQVDWRTLARLIKHNKSYTGKGVRLLSCSTGKDPNGFAQNLANKLGVPVSAPSDLLWAYRDGSTIVAPRLSRDPKSPLFRCPDLSKTGKFITFYPGGNKKWKK